MFSSNILCFMSSFSFKGDTLYRLILSGGIDLFIPRIVLRGGYNITGHRAAPAPALTEVASKQEIAEVSVTVASHTRLRPKRHEITVSSRVSCHQFGRGLMVP